VIMSPELSDLPASRDFVVFSDDNFRVAEHSVQHEKTRPAAGTASPESTIST
jgi:hypothetical protein